jgi:hypothetical protein
MEKVKSALKRPTAFLPLPFPDPSYSLTLVQCSQHSGKGEIQVHALFTGFKLGK